MADADALAQYLAGPVRSILCGGACHPAPAESAGPPHAIVLCGSAVLPLLPLCAAEFWKARESWCEKDKESTLPRLFITGGVGHSTELLHAAVSSDPAAAAAAKKVATFLTLEGPAADGMEPEAMVTARILHFSHGIPTDSFALEARSTNGGHNAELTVPHVLAWAQVMCPESDSLRVLLFQEPTMLRRSHHSFEKHFLAASTPVLLESKSTTPYLGIFGESKPLAGLPWTPERYLGLLLGEVPRLTDGPEGYGPKGRNFITHCDIPDHVRAAYTALSQRAATLAKR